MNTTTVVNVDFVRFANRLAAAVGWAEHFERNKRFDLAADEWRLAAHLADCICRSDFRTAFPEEYAS